MIHYLFPTPVYVTNVTEDFSKENEQLNKFEIVKVGSGNFGDRSLNTYVLDDYRLGKLSRWILQQVESFSNQELFKDAEVKRYVFLQSWVSVKQPQQHHNPHSHANSVISGVYYWEEVKQPLVFLSSRHIEFGPTQHNNGQFILEVKPGTLVLFPSHVMHTVPSNNTDTPRKSLAFNCIPTIGLGCHEHLTHINLSRLKHKLVF